MRSEYTVYRQHAGGVWSGAGKSGQFLQRVRCREQVRDVCREEYVSLVNADIQKLKDEFQRYSSKNVSTCRAFVTWPARKAPAGGTAAIAVKNADKPDDTTSRTNYCPFVAVYTGNAVGALSKVASATAPLSTKTAVCAFTCTAGTEYRIMVAGHTNLPTFGDYMLSWKVGDAQPPAAPSNDNRADATVISGSQGDFGQTTVGATAEASDPLPRFVKGATSSVWWKWTASETGTATFSTSGSDFLAVLGVYREDLSVVGEDCGSGQDFSEVVFECIKGETYLVCVAGADGATGEAVLNWQADTTKSVTIEFDGNGGTPARQTRAYAYGAAIAAFPASPAMAGYAFAGWFDANGTQAVPGVTVATAPLTLSAGWTPNTYTVAFHANGGSGSMSSIGMTYGAYANLPASTLSRAGYAFAGWNTTASGSGDAYADKEEIHNLTATAGATVVLYAQWLANGAQASVVFNAQGGKFSNGAATKTVAATPGNLWGKMYMPAKDGQVFVGWYTAKEGGTLVTSSSVVLDYYATYYAHWTPRLGLAAASEWPNAFETDSWCGQGAVSHDGKDALRSGIIYDSQNSYLITRVTGPGTLTFWWKVSCEAGGNDALRFLLDGAQKYSISGEKDWAKVTVDVTGAGTHVLKWNYTKNGSVSKGQDFGWLDQIQWTAK